MKIVTSGCSFTHAPDSWANYLKEQYDLINVAEGGGGNEMNIRNISRAVYEHNPDYAILQISGIDRYELISDELIDFESDAVIKNENYTWLKSTGDIEWARDLDSRISKPITNYMKYCYNETHQILRTLSAIRNFQTQCYQQNVKHKIFFWQSELSPERKEIIFRNKELTFWYSSIDWDHVWFYGPTGGLSEWGIDNGYTGALHEDHINNPPQGWAILNGKKTMVGHPSTECHQAFAEQIVKEWINNAS